MAEKTPVDLKQAILNLIESSHHLLTKKEISRLLGIKGARRRELKRLLAEIKEEGYGSRIVKKRSSNHEDTATGRKEKIRPRRNADQAHLGLFQKKGNHGQIVPCHRKDPFATAWCEAEIAANLNDRDVVLFRQDFTDRVHIEKNLGSIHAPKVYSLMAIHAHQLPYTFSEEATRIADAGQIPPLGKRTDFRHIPLVTIDGEDARDFDDAVWAMPDPDPRNEGGWRLIVAIADVSYYVRPGDILDQEAYLRGNSVYFPDRVVPMLPESLSNGLCSLKPNEDRACLAVEMIINAVGKVKSHRFKRGLMRSKARLTYNQVQKAINGELDTVTEPLWETVIQPLYGAYCSLLKARQNRGTLDLNLPERHVVFDEENRIKAVVPRTQLESHKLIEEFMIAANVTAAKTLLIKKWPSLFRIHDVPDSTRVENLKEVLKSFKINLPRVKHFTPSHFNIILQRAQRSPEQHLINELVLRSQSQARYAPDNIGHFGLSLTHYCHFTSPIRRYADLIVHRSLIAALELGEGGQEPIAFEQLEEIGDHISATERLAASAEREVMDRYLAAFLEKEVGNIFHGSIVGVSNAGLFVGLSDSGAQGFIPKSRLGGDYYIFDPNQHRYIGARTRKVYQLGQPLTVLLEMSDPLTSSIHFGIVEEKSEKPHKKREIKGRKKAEHPQPEEKKERKKKTVKRKKH